MAPLNVPFKSQYKSKPLKSSLFFWMTKFNFHQNLQSKSIQNQTKICSIPNRLSRMIESQPLIVKIFNDFNSLINQNLAQAFLKSRNIHVYIDS